MFAVPGSIFSENSRGTNYLISQGARLVRSYEDVIEEISMLGRIMPSREDAEVSDEAATELSEKEDQVYRLLSYEPVQIDSISSMAKLAIKDVSVILMGLEMKGRIREMPGKKYARKV